MRKHTAAQEAQTAAKHVEFLLDVVTFAKKSATQKGLASSLLMI
jgi:hypothetical protein